MRLPVRSTRVLSLASGRPNGTQGGCSAGLQAATETGGRFRHGTSVVLTRGAAQARWPGFLPPLA